MRTIITNHAAVSWHGEKPPGLCDVNGESILHRLVRLLRNIGKQDAIICSINRNVRIPGAKLFVPAYRSFGEIAEFFNSRQKWRHETLFLRSSVFYTETALRTILKTPTPDFTFFGKFIHGDPSGSEIHAIKFVGHQKFYDSCRSLLKTPESPDAVEWLLYRKMCELDFDSHGFGGHFEQISDETTHFSRIESIEKFIASHAQDNHKVV